MGFYWQAGLKESIVVCWHNILQSKCDLRLWALHAKISWPTPRRRNIFRILITCLQSLLLMFRKWNIVRGREGASKQILGSQIGKTLIRHSLEKPYPLLLLLATSLAPSWTLGFWAEAMPFKGLDSPLCVASGTKKIQRHSLVCRTRDKKDAVKRNYSKPWLCVYKNTLFCCSRISGGGQDLLAPPYPHPWHGVTAGVNVEVHV